MAILRNSEIDLSDTLIGTVLSVNEKDRTVVAYIPRLMSGIPNSKFKRSSITTQNSIYKISGYSSFNKTVQIQNGITLKAWNAKIKMPEVGSKVEVHFIDNNIKDAFWYMNFNPDGDNEYIESEKYSKLFSLSVNEKLIDVSEDDEIVLNLNQANAVLIENEKNKRILLEPKKDIIKSVSFPKIIEEGDIWFNKTNKNFYIYKNQKYSRLIEETELEAVYKAIEKIFKRVKYIPDLENVDFSKLNDGDVVSRSSDIIFYKESEVKVDSGYSFVKSMHLFLNDGVPIDGFYEVIKTTKVEDGEEIPVEYLRKLDGKFSTSEKEFSCQVQLLSTKISIPNTVSNPFYFRVIAKNSETGFSKETDFYIDIITKEKLVNGETIIEKYYYLLYVENIGTSEEKKTKLSMGVLEENKITFDTFSFPKSVIDSIEILDKNGGVFSSGHFESIIFNLKYIPESVPSAIDNYTILLEKINELENRINSLT